MNSEMSRRQLLVAVTLVGLLSFVGMHCQATIVGAQSFGDELDGARITVTFAQQGAQSTTINASGPATGSASLPNLFSFEVSGDTFLNTWKLSNDTTFDIIRLVEFDLTGTQSTDPNGVIYSPGVLFDDGTSPSTPDGFAGRAGAQYVSGPLILNSFESVPWADPMNTGDEFVRETIEYSNFGPLQTSVWLDDTDIVGVKTEPEVPEPGTFALLLLAAASLGFGRARQ